MNTKQKNILIGTIIALGTAIATLIASGNILSLAGLTYILISLGIGIIAGLLVKEWNYLVAVIIGVIIFSICNIKTLFEIWISFAVSLGASIILLLISKEVIR